MSEQEQQQPQEKTRKYDMETILQEWDNDKVIDPTKLDVEICSVPSLHSKYIRYYHFFREELAKEESRLAKATNIKRKYYRGECTLEDLRKLGWHQYQGPRVNSNTEMNAVLEADFDMIKIREEVSKMKSAVATLEYILKNITSRDYSLKNLLEYMKFINGA